MRLNAVIVLLVGMLVASPVSAATSVYTDSSNFAGFANATNVGESLGGADGSAATIPIGGWIAYQVTTPFTEIDFFLKLESVTGGTTRFYVGRSDGAGFFSSLTSRLINLTSGSNVVSTTAAEQSFCADLGGCDVFIVQAWTGTTLGLDSAIAANPEPSAWALMIFGFIGLAWRMKKLKRDGKFQPHSAFA